MWKVAIKHVHEMIKDPTREQRSHSDGTKLLQPSDFDRHWWVRNGGIERVAEVLEPVIRTSKQRATSKRASHQAGGGGNSTRRELSHFELDAEASFTNSWTDMDAYTPPRLWGYAGIEA
ncbi:hypothetical protein GN958_ATG18559 [Phytophthora infestans]|uniref:Uncharacterized protein n=1 Tax=Phytophthora infestans TaxID=4787 RepID=A0A8S9TW46_PHYIN|nr:hypothetical protein GN958_ATG18559 [Phytophthora infestans]